MKEQFLTCLRGDKLDLLSVCFINRQFWSPTGPPVREGLDWAGGVAALSFFPVFYFCSPSFFPTLSVSLSLSSSLSLAFLLFLSLLAVFPYLFLFSFPCDLRCVDTHSPAQSSPVDSNLRHRRWACYQGS